MARIRDFFSFLTTCYTSDNVKSRIPTEGEILKSNLHVFSYDDLEITTENFHPGNELGRGGFGTVFKGSIDEQSFVPAEPGNGMVIAIKKLNEGSSQGHTEWLAETTFLGQLSHPNLVKLIGYCLEGDNRLLVYEFMPMGSLDNHLFMGAPNVQPLSWNCRMRIALGAGKGIAFLHRDDVKVIYRDIKTANILLDANYNVKLSDFGLAKDGPTGNKSHVTTGVMGTWGYADPAYLVSGHLSLKSDVYGFGVVLLEIVSGKRVLDRTRPTGEYNLVHWAKPHLKKREVHRVFDSRIEVQYSLSAARKAARLVTLCLDENPKLRPKMVKVVVMLEQLQQTGILPKETQKNGPQS